MLVAAAWACSSAAPSARLAPSARGPKRPNSNVLRADYIGSAACAACHPQAYAAWQTAPMHRMTRDLATTEVAARFDGERLTLGGDVATLGQHGGPRILGPVPARPPTVFCRAKGVGG